ncbi:MAG: 23S rRNA (guanosine(2251)-2'-O)-methyltransferase RlmB [Candidatus Shikimatogenerans bostrichidophilus]|nr:MAG: 23S rRNA (guanosine(2251)-2'-O)-methyltransferase RlmB [Candidatus Shikimatogenerans bostrichidophilus]
MRQNNITIYGYNPIKEAINSRYVNILIIFINKNKFIKYNLLINKIKKKKIPIKIITKEKINKIILNKNINNCQGIIAKLNIIKNFNLNDIIINKKKKIILILYNITDIINIGAIIRISVCFNVDFIIIPNNYYIYNPKLIKISSGAIFKIPICRVKNIETSIHFLKKNFIKIFSITEKGNTNINNPILFKSNKSFALILGNEEKGIPNNILNYSDYKVYIPINKKKIKSLNVTIAGAIILYELNKFL